MSDEISNEEVEQIRSQAQAIVGPYGLTVEVHPEWMRVGVKGDARVYEGTIVLVPGPDWNSDDLEKGVVAQISTEVTNKVRGVTGVMLDIIPHS